MNAVADAAIVILAGGEATRLPGKLERPIEGEPMLLRVYRRARATAWPVYVAAKGSFSSGIDAQLDCPILIDRWPRGGPLTALVSACGSIPHPRIFALAADEPNVDAALLETLATAWQPGDEAVVPEHDGRVEPLVALYERATLLREGFPLCVRGDAAMHALVERARMRRVRVDPAYFANVNTPADFRRATRNNR
jgi:molybdopterin-guanine dinucleotide biosynthesis protein A